jgi:general stress protein 26
MPGVEDRIDAVEVSSLLAGAAKAIRSVRYCWLATAAEDGFANLRPMGRLLRDAGDEKDEWTIQFIADGRSRKVTDMRRAGRVAIIIQRDPDDAFVTLIGKATLCESESEVRKRWKGAYDAYFPSESDRANAIFVEVDIARMELWIRGVTPEPFGLRPTILERNHGCGWRAVFR